MRIRKLIGKAVAASLIAAAMAGPASATIHVGDTLDIQYLWPDLSTVFADSGNFTYTGPGQSVLSDSITTVILGNNAVNFVNDQALTGIPYASGAFNGPVLFDLSNGSAFSGWSVTSATATYPVLFTPLLRMG